MPVRTLHALPCLVLAAVACLGWPAYAQRGVHYPHGPWSPLGHIGRSALARGGPLVGYFQPVQIILPEGAVVSLASDGTFTEPAAAPLKAGLLIGPVYRLRISEIPGYPGEELFPTIELVDRLYPPPGLAWKFAIPIEITQADLEAAFSGQFVTRVVYLEDPENALPVQGDPQHPVWWDASPRDNPLELADRLGRPMAIVRLGGRVPDADLEADAAFLAGCPPFVLPTYHNMPPEEDAEHDHPQPGLEQDPTNTKAAASPSGSHAGGIQQPATEVDPAVTPPSAKPRRGVVRNVGLRPKPNTSQR
ncbi:MAG: hypothetical protein K6T86_07650 [Pirellulales bacterium]|nr:hypothetical protein [Pirellulales bacterium]